MRILLVGVGDPTPTFIRRRIAGLVKSGVQLVIAIGYKQTIGFPREVEVVRLGELSEIGVRGYLSILRCLVTKPMCFLLILRSINYSGFWYRIRLAIRYLPICFVRDIQMVHVQWLGQVPNLYWLKSFYRVPIIASARGSQVTVYPHTKPGYGDMIRQALCVVDACHLVSNDLRKAVLALGADEKKLFINYNGIDLNRFKPTNQRDSVDKTMRLISVGALIWRKGYVFQLTVLQQLLARNVPASLTIVGEGPDREGLIYMCKALGLKEYVILTGQLNESEIVERLTKSDAYLSTSLAEGLPNSVVEAAACGLPVVAFDCEGIREVVDHGVSGYVVGRGMIGEMAAFIEILQDGALRGRMGRYARQRMEDLFDQDKCVAEMIGHYQRMMHAG